MSSICPNCVAATNPVNTPIHLILEDAVSPSPRRLQWLYYIQSPQLHMKKWFLFRSHPRNRLRKMDGCIMRKNVACSRPTTAIGQESASIWLLMAWRNEPDTLGSSLIAVWLMCRSLISVHQLGKRWKQHESWQNRMKCSPQQPENAAIVPSHHGDRSLPVQHSILCRQACGGPDTCSYQVLPNWSQQVTKATISIVFSETIWDTNQWIVNWLPPSQSYNKCWKIQRSGCWTWLKSPSKGALNKLSGVSVWPWCCKSTCETAISPLH